MPYSRLFYHFVWATKERLPLITESNRERLYAIIAARVKESRGMLYVINGMADHVHLVVALPPSGSLSTFVGQVKGSSSHLGSRLEVGSTLFAWQAEYGVVSVSETHLPTVVRYVQQQQHHHATGTVDVRLENCGQEKRGTASRVKQRKSPSE
jgi:putative transposase